METQFWRLFAIGFLLVNTMCVIVIFDVLVLGGIYMTSFIVLFSSLFFLNRRLFFSRK